VDSTNYFVERGAVLLAALRLWAESRQKTDADLRALIDSASPTTLVNIARELAESHSPDELHASVQLEGIAYAPLPSLSDTLDFARKGLQPS
jgi:Arc/MetJ-type ribon-helix-helix transcriptional regulator